MWKHVLCRQAPYISEFLFMIVTRLSRIFLRIARRSSIHRLQLGFVNVFIAPIWFICFTTLNVMYLRKSVRDVVVLKCCSKLAANESDFCRFLSRRRRWVVPAPYGTIYLVDINETHYWGSFYGACIGIFRFIQKSVFDPNTCTIKWAPIMGFVDVH